MKPVKLIVVIILLILSIFVSHSLPTAKYVGTGFISDLKIPATFSDWKGQDISSEVGLRNLNTATYNFVGEALAYQYVKSTGQSLLFIILDAGNFHHPKVCFTGAGYEITELADSNFSIPGNSLRTHTLFTERDSATSFSFYWIVIDKNIAHEWVEQKAKQLLFSLTGKKRVGLMVRIDIPASQADIKESTALAQQFITDIIPFLQKDETEYIFGRN